MAGYILHNQVHEELLELSSTLCEERVLIRFGCVRLVRAKSCKNKLFYAPVIPSSFVLLLFPEGVRPEEMHVKPNGYQASMKFLDILQQESVNFRLKEVLGCVTTGSLVFLLDCRTAENALEVLEKAENCSRDEARFIWPCSSLYMHCMECVALDNEQQAAITSSKEVSLPSWRRYYNYPTCLLCAERLDKTLTGYRQLGAICRCGKRNLSNGVHSSDGLRNETFAASTAVDNSGCGSRSSCSCMIESSCPICKLLLRTLKDQQGEKILIKSSLVSFSSSTTDQSIKKNNDEVSSGPLSSPLPEVPRCVACGRAEDPWACLICGFIGCSRYQAMHAKEHYTATGHYFSINLLTQEVWDYESDRFVHRLVVCMDSATGSTSRIQYPEREATGGGNFFDPLTDVSSSGAHTSVFDGDEGGGNACDVAVAKKKEMFFKKKCLSAKYDTHSTYHTQYSIMLKNDLDTSRNLLEATVVFDMASQEAWEHFYGPRARQIKFLFKEEKHFSLVGRENERKEEVARHFSSSQPSEVLLSDLEQPVQFLVQAMKSYHGARVEIGKTDMEIRNLKEEEVELLKLYEEKRHVLSEMMAKNALEIKHLNDELEEQKVVREEIKANISTASSLRARGNDASEGWLAFAALAPANSGSSTKKKKK